MPHDVALIATIAIGFALAFIFGFIANPTRSAAAGRLSCGGRMSSALPLRALSPIARWRGSWPRSASCCSCSASACIFRSPI